MTINKMASVSKNPAFSEEQEVRIIHTPFIENDDTNFKMISHVSYMKHRVSSNMITSYFELQFTLHEAYPSIKEVILGPKCITDVQELKNLLICNGFPHVTVKNSTASYR